MRIVAPSATAARPFPVDAVVLEEDTDLVRSAERDVVDEPVEGLGELLAEATLMEPIEPGSVLVRGDAPLRFLAVVHDLGREPSWDERWIAAAVKATLREADDRGPATLALPVLGGMHGSFGAAAFTRLLLEALEGAMPRKLQGMWIRLPAGAKPEELAVLAELGVEIPATPPAAAGPAPPPRRGAPASPSGTPLRFGPPGR